MEKIKYIIYCVNRIDYKNMFKVAKKISKKSKRPLFITFFDIAFCGLVYGAGYYDYQEFEFYLLNRKQRKTYLTRTKNNLIISKYNNKNNFDIMDDKSKFNKKFKKYLNREYMIINKKNFTKFCDFFQKHKSIICKIIDGEGGRGIERFELDSTIDLKKLYNELLEKKETLIEECIVQHPELSKLYQKSINTLRLFTFYNEENVLVLNYVFKIGNGGITDNFASGGMYTFADNTGTIIVPAIDKDDNIHDIHPVTKEKIIGFKIPYFKEACDLVCKAAKEIPDIKYIGWDVAISKDGPCIIEGNSFPGVFQIKPSLMKDMGLIPKYNKYMDIK